MKQAKWNISDKFLYGADYNPDQWLDRPDILDDDLKLMKKASVNVVSLGIFAWSALEPSEGLFQFEWMDDIIEKLTGNGVDIFLATPSGARPDWLAAKYPEVLRVNERGQRNLFGARHNHCFSSPAYREKVKIINGKLAERYGHHPGVILWHISNEFSGECHCNLCQEQFRLWLKKRYGTLEALNKAWWNSFWSHLVSDWQYIHSPVVHGEQTVHGLNLDWKRFCNDMIVDFLQYEINTVRDIVPNIPVTTNFMMSVEDAEMDPGMDYWRFADTLDIISWDSYPAWHQPGHKFIPQTIKDEPVNDYRRASEVAFHHDLYRSMKNGPFLLMESTPSNVNWQSLSKLKKPGMNILSSLQAVAHGSNSVQYFQWRKGLGSFEKFHGAVVSHDGSDQTRVFQEAAKLGSILKKLAPAASSDYSVETALLYNWENRWAFEDSKGLINNSRKAYLETVKKHYYCLWDLGVPMDIVSGERSLDRYKLLIVPMLYMITEKCAEHIKQFTEQGGVVVTTYQTGLVNESDLCWETGIPGPLADVLGIEVEEIDALHPWEQISMKAETWNNNLFGTKTPAVMDYQEVISLTRARSAAGFIGGIADGLPAVTVNNFGKGKGWHVAGRLDSDSLGEFYRQLLTEQNINNVRQQILENHIEGINVQCRTGKNGNYYFLMNFSGKSVEVKTRFVFENCLEERKSDIFSMKPYDIKILFLDSSSL